MHTDPFSIMWCKFECPTVSWPNLCAIISKQSDKTREVGGNHQKQKHTIQKYYDIEQYLTLNRPERKRLKRQRSGATLIVHIKYETATRRWSLEIYDANVMGLWTLWTCPKEDSRAYDWDKSSESARAVKWESRVVRSRIFASIKPKINWKRAKSGSKFPSIC